MHYIQWAWGNWTHTTSLGLADLARAAQRLTRQQGSSSSSTRVHSDFHRFKMQMLLQAVNSNQKLCPFTQHRAAIFGHFWWQGWHSGPVNISATDPITHPHQSFLQIYSALISKCQTESMRTHVKQNRAGSSASLTRRFSRILRGAWNATGVCVRSVPSRAVPGVRVPLIRSSDCVWTRSRLTSSSAHLLKAPAASIKRHRRPQQPDGN